MEGKAHGVIAYIGETSDLKRRKVQHIRSNSVISVDTHVYEWKLADGRSTPGTRRKHEKFKIEQHNPLLNKIGGGGGESVVAD